MLLIESDKGFLEQYYVLSILNHGGANLSFLDQNLIVISQVQSWRVAIKVKKLQALSFVEALASYAAWLVVGWCTKEHAHDAQPLRCRFFQC